MTLTRDEIQALLPFIANDTLTGEERTEVAAAVAADPALQSELDALRAIRGTMQDDMPDYTPGEMGLARLMREVEAVAPMQVSRPAQRPWAWQAAAAVFAAAAIGLAVLQFGPGGDTSADFTLASGEEPPVAAAGPAIAVGFAPATTEAQLRALLTDAGVELAGGPTPDGLYYVVPRADVALDAARDTLIASDLVETLELP